MQEFCSFLYLPIIGELTLVNVIVFIVGLIILWLLVTIPVYLAGKVVTGGESTMGDAMIATLFGPIVYIVTLFGVNFFLGELIGSIAYILALVIAFIAWIWVFKASFDTGWLKALAIAVLAILIFAVISILFGTLGVLVPAPFFPRF
jgi:hypothetical protein